MNPRIDYVKQLMGIRKWSASELARRMEVSRSEVTRLLRGQRSGGKKVFDGLIKAFPDEPLRKLFFLPDVYPNVNINEEVVPFKAQMSGGDVIAVKHPEASQTACTLNEKEGIIEIMEHKRITRLEIPPGPVKIKYGKAE